MPTINRRYIDLWGWRRFPWVHQLIGSLWFNTDVDAMDRCCGVLLLGSLAVATAWNYIEATFCSAPSETFLLWFHNIRLMEYGGHLIWWCILNDRYLMTAWEAGDTSLLLCSLMLLKLWLSSLNFLSNRAFLFRRRFSVWMGKLNWSCGCTLRYFHIELGW